MLAALLFAAAAATASAPAARDVVYRVETGGSGVFWSADRPVQSGELVLFHEYPAGTLVSVRRSDVRRVAAEPRAKLRPGYVDIGITAGGARKDTAAAGGKGSARNEPAGPGARKDGTALLNPDRKYQPDIDSKQVPGMNLPYPASPNDYREGRTFAYPAAPAVQTAPGEPPKGPN
ncbi:MAG TPA: hypothetical protein VE007_02110 [Thermoanaerobaculia bacterium]|nr:hypothetical protein [Thermoanaerobaculia bacterium]